MKPFRPGVSDAFLRGAGFRIHARPGQGSEPLWERNGRVCGQTKAEELAIREITQQKQKGK